MQRKEGQAQRETKKGGETCHFPTLFLDIMISHLEVMRLDKPPQRELFLSPESPTPCYSARLLHREDPVPFTHT